MVTWATLTPSPPGAFVAGGDKLAHVLAYLVLALWFGGLFGGRERVVSALALAALGVALEFLQQAGGVRQLELRDMLANGFGVLSGWALSRHPWFSVVPLLDRALARVRAG
jgi:VanZ family protein